MSVPARGITVGGGHPVWSDTGDPILVGQAVEVYVRNCEPWDGVVHTVASEEITVDETYIDAGGTWDPSDVSPEELVRITEEAS